MAVIQKEFNYMAFPQSFSRGNPIPLDKSSLWFSMEEMSNYSKTDATAYVGQILTLVNEADNSAKAYIIANAAGDLVEVGAATLGDNKTITLSPEGVLSLKNWGKEYYRWVDAVGEEGKEGYVAAHHEKQLVDETHPWIAGLEPKSVAGTDGTFEIAWYQPSTTTVEGLSSTVNSLRTSVETIQQTIGGVDTEGTILHDLAGKLDKTGGIMTGDLVLSDSSKAASEAVVDTKIATAIGSAGHLKRSVVEQLPEVSAADPDTIYMVKDTSITSGDAYKEYMLIEGAMVQIGDTSVDLSPYAQKVVPAAEDNIAVLAADGSLKDGGKTIAGILTEVDTKLEGYVAKETGKSLVADDQITKLAGLANIKSIGTNLTLSEEGVLAGAAEYTLPAATTGTLGGVKVGSGLSITTEGVLATKVVAENGLSLGENGIAMGLASADAAGAMSAEMFTKVSNIAANAQVNVIEGALIGGVEATINEAKQVEIPVASTTAFGVVKSSEADNGIAVAADGTMSVNKVGVSKLFVEPDNVLVLDGGNSGI
jgi:hypothetical protein